MNEQTESFPDPIASERGDWTELPPVSELVSIAQPGKEGDRLLIARRATPGDIGGVALPDVMIDDEEARMDGFDAESSSTLMARQYFLGVDGLLPLDALASQADRQSFWLEYLTTQLVLSDDKLRDAATLERVEELVDGDDDYVRQNGLLPELEQNLSEVTVAFDYFDDGVAAKLVRGHEDSDSPTIHAWDRISFEPYENSGVMNVEPHIYSCPERMEAGGILDIQFRAGSFAEDGLEGLHRMQKLRQFILRATHLDHFAQKDDEKVGNGKEYRPLGGGTGVFYDFSKYVDLKFELSKYMVSMRAIMKDIEVEMPGSDDSDKREWLEHAISEQMNLIQMLGPIFTQQVMSILSDDKFEFALELGVKPYHGDGDDEEMEYANYARVPSKSYGGPESNDDDPSQYTDVEIPECLRDPRHKNLYLETIRDVDASFADVGGLEGVIEELRLIADSIFYADDIQAQGIKSPRASVIMESEPGFGKTLLAEALANYLEAKLIVVSSAQLKDMWQGETEKNTAEIFRMVELLGKDGPVILFFDELDTLFSNRNDATSSEIDKGQIGQMLNEMGKRYPNVMIIGATNAKDGVDAALIRPGRFDSKIKIERPGADGLKKIFEARLGHHQRVGASLVLDPELDIDELAQYVDKTKLSGAAIATAIEKAIEINTILARREKQEVPPLSQELIMLRLRKIYEENEQGNFVGFSGARRVVS